MQKSLDDSKAMENEKGHREKEAVQMMDTKTSSRELYGESMQQDADTAESTEGRLAEVQQDSDELNQFNKGDTPGVGASNKTADTLPAVAGECMTTAHVGVREGTAVRHEDGTFESHDAPRSGNTRDQQLPSKTGTQEVFTSDLDPQRNSLDLEDDRCLTPEDEKPKLSMDHQENDMQDTKYCPDNLDENIVEDTEDHIHDIGDQNTEIADNTTKCDHGDQNSPTENSTEDGDETGYEDIPGDCSKWGQSSIVHQVTGRYPTLSGQTDIISRSSHTSLKHSVTHL